MSNRASARLRFVMRIAGLPAIALFGVAAAMSIPPARADLIPTLPTVTVPSLPVTLPVTVPTVTAPSLPIGTTVTVSTTVPTLPIDTTTIATTPGTTITVGGGSDPPGGGSPPASSGVTGAIRLPAGLISVPISSVTAPARLLIGRITVSPTWIGERRQQVRLVVRVVDSRGYRVRGASVSLQSSPTRMIGSVGAHKTRVDGTVSLQARTTSVLPMRKGAKLTLVVRAYPAGTAHTASSVARRVVSLPIRPR